MKDNWLAMKIMFSQYSKYELEKFVAKHSEMWKND